MLLAALAVLVSLSACGSGGGGTTEWRDLEVTLPDGWTVFEDEPTRFSVGDGELGEEPGDRGTRRAAAFFTREPGTLPDDWRELVEGALDGTLETDEDVEVGGLPATKLVFSHASNGVPLREMVVLVPSRELVILMQPIVVQGETEGPERFEAYRDEFEALLSSLEFGAPAGDD